MVPPSACSLGCYLREHPSVGRSGLDLSPLVTALPIKSHVAFATLPHVSALVFYFPIQFSQIAPPHLFLSMHFSCLIPVYCLFLSPFILAFQSLTIRLLFYSIQSLFIVVS